MGRDGGRGLTPCSSLRPARDRRRVWSSPPRRAGAPPQQIRSSPALRPASSFARAPRAPRFRGNHLRMALLRFRYAYIIVAVLRSTALRRVVDGSPGRHRYPHGETSSSLLPVVNTVRPHPSGSGRSVLTTGPPPTAHSHSSTAPLVRRVQKAVIGTVARGVDKPFHIIRRNPAQRSTTARGLLSRRQRAASYGAGSRSF